MGFRTLPLSSSSQNGFLQQSIAPQSMIKHNYRASYRLRVVSAKKEDTEEPKKKKQSLFTSVTDALDFAQVRSAEDAQLLEDAREATSTGGQMSKEQVQNH